MARGVELRQLPCLLGRQERQVWLFLTQEQPLHVPARLQRQQAIMYGGAVRQASVRMCPPEAPRERGSGWVGGL